MSIDGVEKGPAPVAEAGAARRPSVAELYKSYGRKVFNLAYRMTGDRSAAEDILQEVFVRIMERYEQFKGDSSVFSWMFTITRNICLRTKQRSFRIFEKLIASAGRPYAASLTTKWRDTTTSSRSRTDA